ncbi:MAG: hypothetical protein J6J30_05670 [Clostridia bacterium]|nr:hypothetical protein [Clostridia bacterium]
MKKSFNLTKILLCLVLAFSLVIGVIVVSGDANTTTYTFDFEEATSGSYNGSSGWSYDKPAGGIAGNETSLLKFDPPARNTYNISFIMPSASDKKYALDYNSEYEVTFKYYSEGIGGGVLGDFMLRDNVALLGGATLELDSRNGTGGVWKTATVSFVPASENKTLSFGLNVSGQYSKVCIYFDDITIKATKIEQGEPDATFLNTADGIINFDSGENKNLNSSDLKYVSGEKRYIVGNSTNMLKFTAAAAGTDYGVAFYNGMATVLVKPGKYYTVKFKYYNPSKTGKVNFTVGTSAENSAWTNYQIGDIITLTNDTQGWVNGEASFVVTPKTENANYLFIRVKSDVMGNETYFDNFQIVEEPDMDIDIIDIDLDGTNAALTSAGWSWVDGKAEPVGGNETTMLRFDPDEARLKYYVTKLYKGKRTIPIKDGANYSLSFDYYAEGYEGTLGEFYIKNKSGENLFKADLDISNEKGTDGGWKKANFIFTATADIDDILQIMCYAKAENTSAVVYFDNFRLVRIDNVIANEKMLLTEKEAFEVSVGRNTEDFEGYADISLQFKLGFKSTYGNSKVIEIAGEKYLVSDYGMIYRPKKLDIMGPMRFDEALMADDLVSAGYHTKVVDSAADYIKFTSKIINIRALYKDMDIEVKPFIVISPMNGTGTVYTYGEAITLNVLDVASTSQNDAVKQFVSQ